MQTEEQASNKSKSLAALFEHTTIYSITWLLLLLALMCVTGKIENVLFIKGALIFSGITFIFHSLQDFITSKINHELTEKAKFTKNYRPFFNMVGLDQLLHFFQIIITFWIIFLK